jgi:hypothetical protein
MTEPFTVSRMDRARLVKAAWREVGFRERVYPKWVAAGRMKQAEADEEIAAMREIARELERPR